VAALQRVHIGFNPCLETRAAHLAVAVQCARLPPQRTPAHPHPVQVAGCSRELVHPRSSGSLGPSPNRFTCAGLAAGEGSDRPSGLESSSAFLLLTGSCGVAGHSLAPDSAQTLEGKSACSISLGPCQVLLLAGCHCFCQFPKKTGECSVLYLTECRRT
jgi:hypothetical protein